MKPRSPGPHRTERAVYVAGFAFFLTDALAAFPMETPFAFYAIAVWAGLLKKAKSELDELRYAEGCAALTHYNSLLYGRSSLTERTIKLCGAP